MNKQIALLGGNGFVGSHLSSALIKAGWHVRVLSRSPDLLADIAVLPQARLWRIDPYDETALTDAFSGCAAVVNLVGILNESGRDGSGFERAHVTLTERCMSAMRTAGVSRLLQMSALRAGEGDSFYLKSKGKAEALALESDLDVTSFQPSVIFGSGDSFVNRFAQLLRLTPLMPLACAESRFEPVYVGDVAAAMVVCLADTRTQGQTYQLGGPDQLSLREIVQFISQVMKVKRLIIGLPDVLSRLQASIMNFVPGKPFSTDNYLSLQVDSVCSSDGLAELGISKTPMKVAVPEYLGRSGRLSRLSRYRAGAR